MKFTPKNIVVGISLSLMLVIAFAPHLFAKEGESGGSTTTTNTGTSTETVKPTTTTTTRSGSSDSTNSTRKSQTEPEKTETTEAATEDKADNPRGELRHEMTREKLDDKKKAVCESHQSAVNTAMMDVVTRSKNHLDRITAIYTMTTKFYVDKGLSVSNYDALVATVDAAKTAAIAANSELTSTPQFSCTSDGPKADIQAFRNKRLDKVDAFGVYRDAVKALVKAVKAAAETASTTTGGTN